MGSVKKRFWSKVDIKDSSCWEWLANKWSNGYGQLWIGRPVISFSTTVLAHRVSWMLENDKDIPEGMFVLHKCDNPGCVNPDHLYLGSHCDNMSDMINKQRYGRPNAILSEIDITEVRNMLLLGHTHQDTADKFGVCKSTITHISTGRNWAGI